MALEWLDTSHFTGFRAVGLAHVTKLACPALLAVARVLVTFHLGLTKHAMASDETVALSPTRARTSLITEQSMIPRLAAVAHSGSFITGFQAVLVAF